MTDLFQSELDGHLARLTTLLENQAFADAVPVAEEATKRFPDSAELLRLYAITLHQLDRRDEALRLLYKAEKLSPDSLEVQCNLASLEVADGRADAAIERMRAALRVTPGHPLILLTLGNALMAAARYGQARDSYAMATYGAPSHPGLRLNVAAAELAIDRAAQAEVHAREALQIAPTMAPAHAMLGHTHRARGQFTEAFQAYLQAEALEPHNGEHPYHAGMMLDELGRLDDAQAAFARSLQLNENNGAALSQRIFTLRQLCQWSELETLAARLRVAVADGMPGITPFSFLA